MFGLIIIAWLSKGKAKKHHNFSLWFIAIICTILKVILIFIDKHEEDKNDIINKDTNWFFILFGIFAYFCIIFLRAFVYVNLKIFMDENFIPPNEILIYYGIIGTIISFIVCIISTFVECSYDFINDYICTVPNIKDEHYIYNSNKKYFDSFILYYKTLNGEINNKFFSDDLGLEIFFEIIVILAGTTLYILYRKYFMKVIQDLSPGHAIFSYSINKIIPKIILPIITLFCEKDFFSENHEKNIIVKYILGFINNIFAIIGFAIYLEMIILHFCGLDHDIKENIIKRGDEDRMYSELAHGINNNDDNDDDEENKEENKGVL